MNNLTWNGKQGFSQPPTKPFYVPYHNDPIMGSIAGAGVFGGWVEERGLTFLAVDLSGVSSPTVGCVMDVVDLSVHTA